MQARHFDVLIAGAGIMGLSTAFELSRTGMRIALVDTHLQQARFKASWAAAGILVTRGARRPLSAFRRFYLDSIALYPEWLDAIANASGIQVPYTQAGDYQVFDRSSEAGEKAYQEKIAQLAREESHGWQATPGLPHFLKPYAEAKGEVTTLHFPEEAYVNNRILLDALAEACKRRGVLFFESGMEPGNLNVSHLLNHPSSFEITLSDGAKVAGSNLLVTAGPFSESWLGALGFQSSLIPVRGQVAMIPKPWAEKAMTHVHEDLYLVPRGETLIVGATTEPNAWSYDFDAQGHATLQARLQALLPQVPFTPLEAWSGLRPRTRDRLPLMGKIPGHDHAFICTGHYKCGISMAPLAGKTMATLISGSGLVGLANLGSKAGRLPADIEAFDPARKGALKPKAVPAA